MRALLVASALAFSGCAVQPLAEVPPLMAAQRELRIHGDTRFTPDERRAIERAAFEWVRFTEGRARITIVWDLDERTLLDAPLPLLVRSERTAETGRRGGVTIDGITRLVPETCALYLSVQACAQHELGHQLGLEHFEGIRGQVMSTCDAAGVLRGCSSSTVFGAADLAECIRVGVCAKPNRDVTTVTVTIDPAIPNVSPEYP